MPSMSMRTGGVEPPQREATRLLRGELADAQASARFVQRRSAGFEPAPTGITARDAAVTPRPQRGRRDSNPHRLGRQPSALPALSYVLLHVQVARAGFEPAARAHEAREVPVPPPRNAGLVGRTRTCGLRRPKPAGWPGSPTTRRRTRPPAGLEPAASGLRARRHRPSTTGARLAKGRDWRVDGGAVAFAPDDVASQQRSC
jgi:hypothetical protein